LKIATKSGFFLKQDVSKWDAGFFSTTAVEAAGMDPQQRILLEVTYEAFENGWLSTTPLKVLVCHSQLSSWHAYGCSGRDKNILVSCF
jgi:hypothetical protein